MTTKVVLVFHSKTSHPEHPQKPQGKLPETFETIKLSDCVSINSVAYLFPVYEKKGGLETANSLCQ